MSLSSTATLNLHQLNPAQRLTVTTWRYATAKVDRVLDSDAILEHAAIHAVLGSLRDVDDQAHLFARHADAYPEVALVHSLLHDSSGEPLAFDLLDTAFLLRFQELTSALTTSVDHA